jgi:diacylglycerol kinase (ATP)
MTDPASDPTPLLVVCNPASGRGRARRVAERVGRELGRRSVPHRMSTPASVEATVAVLTDAAGAGTRTIVVGGDGLVHHAVEAFADTTSVLGIVPGGTGNDFAAALGLPSDLPAAVTTALADPVPVDLLRSVPGGHHAATVATLGFSAAVNERAERMSFPRGSSRYTVATLLELARLTSHPVVIEVDGESHRFDATLVAVAGTSMFGGGMRIAPDARADDGLADVVVVRRVGRLTLLRVLPRAFSGRHVDHPAVQTLRGRRITLSAEGPTALTVRADGEPFSQTPIQIEVAPGAVLVAGAHP